MAEDRNTRRRRQHEARRRSRRSAAVAARRRRRRVLEVAVGAAAVVAAVLVGVWQFGGDETASESSLEVTVVGDDFSFAPDPARARSGDVAITLRNEGSAGHELIVLESGIELTDPGDFDESMVLGRIPSIARDTTYTETVRLEPGTYQLVCLLPGHLEAGMESDLIIE